MNEQLRLQKHVTDRAHNILNQTVLFEKRNQSKLLNDVIEKALRKLDDAMKDDSTREAVENQIFQSALIGLSKGQMTYENDPLLPMILETIHNEVAQIKNLSVEE